MDGGTDRIDPARVIEPLASPRAPRPRLVNLGCGPVAHPDWINVDIAPRDPCVLEADFHHSLPFPDGSIDAVYHSHVLEHLDRDSAAQFLADNVRVLMPGGILRIAVPDLEALCRHYLDALEAAQRGGSGAAELYEWSRLDLMDQMVRRQNCGKLLEFLSGIDLAAHPAIAARLTLDLQRYLGLRRDGAAGAPANGALKSWHEVRRRARHVARRLRERIAAALVRCVAGRRAADAFVEGLFRTSGEVHQWMYDAYSLRSIMRDAGLVDVALKQADESAIPGFAEYQLDAVGARIRRPGSLFAEGRKP